MTKTNLSVWPSRKIPPEDGERAKFPKCFISNKNTMMDVVQNYDSYDNESVLFDNSTEKWDSSRL
jgi:hypothetical protein